MGGWKGWRGLAVKQVIERMSGGVLRFVMTGGMGGLRPVRGATG